MSADQDDLPWASRTAPDRVAPRDCIRAARDALNRAYSSPGVSDGRHALTFIAEAVDWQRRALEQMAAEDRPPALAITEQSLLACRCGGDRIMHLAGCPHYGISRKSD